MAHYAKVNNNIVENIIIALDDYFDTFVDTSPGEWIKTSYNTVNVGDKYIRENDIFITPQPFNSWILNENYIWEAPVDKPGEEYEWNEEKQTWDEVAVVPQSDKQE